MGSNVDINTLNPQTTFPGSNKQGSMSTVLSHPCPLADWSNAWLVATFQPLKAVKLIARFQSTDQSAKGHGRPGSWCVPLSVCIFNVQILCKTTLKHVSVCIFNVQILRKTTLKHVPVNRSVLENTKLDHIQFVDQYDCDVLFKLTLWRMMKSNTCT